MKPQYSLSLTLSTSLSFMYSTLNVHVFHLDTYAFYFALINSSINIPPPPLQKTTQNCEFMINKSTNKYTMTHIQKFNKSCH